MEAETPTFSESDADRAHALLAIEEARKTPSSARVGAVIARGDVVLSTGYKGEFEASRAEEVALSKARDAGMKLKGATLPQPSNRVRTLERTACHAPSSSQRGDHHRSHRPVRPNQQVNRQGWKYLRDHRVQMRDFPRDLRDQAKEVAVDFTQVFTKKVGMTGREVRLHDERRTVHHRRGRQSRLPLVGDSMD